MTIQMSEAKQLMQCIRGRLMRLSYDELESLLVRYPDKRDGWRELPHEELSGQRVHVHALMSQWGLIRRRISVEIVLITDDETINPQVVPSVYFERFKSGELGPRAWRIQRLSRRVFRSLFRRWNRKEKEKKGIFYFTV